MKVIIAIDDSPMSTPVLNTIISRHWPKDVQFKVLTVLEPICLPSENPEFADSLVKVYDKRMEHATKWCQSVREKLEAKIPGAKVHFDVRQGSPPAEIIDAAVDWAADKILMGAHSKDVCPHNLVGSVSRRVASHSPCSIEIIRNKEYATKAHKQEPAANVRKR